MNVQNSALRNSDPGTLAPPQPPSRAGLLSIDDVAVELGCSRLQVKRLIFRDRLAANVLRSNPRPGRTRIDDSEIKVAASDVAQYVADGAQDFTSPGNDSRPGE